MAPLKIVLAVDPKRADPQGMLYTIDVECADPVDLAGRMLVNRYLQVAVGLLVLVGGKVWNTYRPYRYESTRIRQGVHTSLDTLMLLECLVDSLGLGAPFVCIGSEYEQYRFRQESGQMLTIEGADFAEHVIFPAFSTPLAEFVAQLARAAGRGAGLLDGIRAELERRGGVGASDISAEFCWLNQPDRWRVVCDRFSKLERQLGGQPS